MFLRRIVDLIHCNCNLERFDVLDFPLLISRSKSQPCRRMYTKPCTQSTKTTATIFWRLELNRTFVDLHVINQSTNCTHSHLAHSIPDRLSSSDDNDMMRRHQTEPASEMLRITTRKLF